MQEQKRFTGFTLPRAFALLALASAATLMLSGCSDAQSQAAPPPPPKVSVTKAVGKTISDWDEYTGRFEAIERVELRPRVSGYIDERRFSEGAEVKKGDVLFLIDARPYKVELDRALAELERVKSQSALAESESRRAKDLLDAHAISKEEFDQRVSQQSQSVSAQRSAQAAVEAARLNVEFTRVTSPISGRVSRALATAGNYVTAGQTPLTSVVSLDPIYVSFDSDERAYLKYAQQNGQASAPVNVGLADESGYPHTGKLTFLDNALDPASGTIRTRALLDNHDRRFAPGLFARVQLLGGSEYAAVLIPDEAIGTDQSKRYVYVVGDKNLVEYRAVTLGGTHDNLRIVRDGLKPGERVIVSGLQRARPGAPVTPENVAQAAMDTKVAQAH